MENLALVKENELEVIVKNSGLEIAEGEQIKQSYQPFLLQLAVIQEQSEKINFANPAEIDETIARELRLKTVKIRTGASDLKDSRKRIYLLRGNLEQAAFNLISATCKLAEDAFIQVEKAREIAESKRKAGLRAERQAELEKYGWTGSGIDLGVFEEKNYNLLLSSVKKEYEDRIAAEKKAEDERIAKEKAEREEREKMKADNERLQKEAEAREKAMAEERRIQAAKLAEEQAKATKEAEAREKIEKELQAKKDAERQAQLDAEIKAAKELEAKQEAEKKAAAAPDKDKLLSFVSGLSMPAMSLTTAYGQITEKVIREKFEGFKEWAVKEINKTQNSLNL